jgi:serine/threonine protein kinase
MAIGAGARVGPYDVIALMGEGAMGQVWRARHTALERDDALKVLPQALAAAASISHDGQFLLYARAAGNANVDLWLLPLSGTPKPLNAAEEQTSSPFTVVVNWAAGLTK